MGENSRSTYGTCVCLLYKLYYILYLTRSLVGNTLSSTSGSHSHASENQHSHLWSTFDHKTADHQHRSGSNASAADHRTSSEHRGTSEHRSHTSEGRSRSREPLKEARSRPPSQQSLKASPANSTHSGYSPIRKERDKDISPLPDEDLLRSSVGRHESSKKWPHPDDLSSHSKHKRSHSKKRPGLDPPLPPYSKKHHRDERSAGGHRGGGGSSRGGTPERKEKRLQHYNHLPPSSEALLHDSGSYGRDGPTFNGKGDLRRRSYESISDEDAYEASRESSQERKSLYETERLSKKDRKRRLTEYTDSSEEEHHVTMSGESRPSPHPPLSTSGGSRPKHKKHKYSKEHKEMWRKLGEHVKEGSSSSNSKHKHGHHHHHKR